MKNLISFGLMCYLNLGFFRGLSYILHQKSLFPVINENILWFGGFAMQDPYFITPLIIFFTKYLLYRTSENPILHRLKKDHPKFNAYIAIHLFIVSVPYVYIPNAYFIGIEAFLICHIIKNFMKKMYLNYQQKRA